MRLIFSVVVVLVYVALVGFILWFMGTRKWSPIRDRVSGLLQLLAVYTFVLALLSASGVFDALGSLRSDLVSSDPLLFLRANFWMLAGLFSAMSVALDPGTSSAFTWLTLPVLVVLLLLLFVYAVVHILVVVPIAYFAYLITSIPVDAILNAPSDVLIEIGTESVRIKALVMKNEATIRNVAVGIPALLFSLFLKVWPLVRRDRSQQ